MINKYSLFFNLDNIITKQDIFTEIVKSISLSEQINELTQIENIEENFIESLKMFKNVKIDDVKNIVENIKLNEKIVSFIQENRDDCFIITNNLDIWVSGLCDKIGCRYFTSKALLSEEGEYVKGVTYLLNKAHIANSFATPYVAIGNSKKDTEIMRCANIGIAYGGIHMPDMSIMDCASHSIFQEDKLCQFLKQLL